MSPLIEYFKQARDGLGVTAKEIQIATGKQMASHWFGYSQWQLPSEADYIKLQVLFEKVAKEKGRKNRLIKSHVELVQEQLTLRRSYQELACEYNLLRRYFSVTAEVPYTDVWDYSPVQYYPGKHPCEKPADMLEHIISSSSREGDLVADFFMGSGSTLKAAVKLGRRGLGVELEKERFEQTAKEMNMKKVKVEISQLGDSSSGEKVSFLVKQNDKVIINDTLWGKASTPFEKVYCVDCLQEPLQVECNNSDVSISANVI